MPSQYWAKRGCLAEGGLFINVLNILSTTTPIVSKKFLLFINLWSYAVDDVIVKLSPLLLYHSVKTLFRVNDIMAITFAYIVCSGQVEYISDEATFFI